MVLGSSLRFLLILGAFFSASSAFAIATKDCPATFTVTLSNIQPFSAGWVATHVAPVERADAELARRFVDEKLKNLHSYSVTGVFQLSEKLKARCNYVNPSIGARARLFTKPKEGPRLKIMITTAVVEAPKKYLKEYAYFILNLEVALTSEKKIFANPEKGSALGFGNEYDSSVTTDVVVGRAKGVRIVSQ